MKAFNSNGAKTVSGAPTQLLAVQALRALAALMVAIAHASEEAEYFFKFIPPLPNEPFGKGVDLFFVISGFIIYYSSARLQGLSNGAFLFLKNRFLRVVPMYFLFTTLMVATVVLVPGGVKEARFDIAQIISSYTFFPYARYDGRIAPILSLGWTLNYEVFFYSLFAIAMAVAGRRAAQVCLGMLGVLVVVGAFVSKDTAAPILFWTFNIIAEFGMGIGLALVHERWGRLKMAGTGKAVLLFTVGFILLYVLNLPQKPLELPRAIVAGIPALMMMSAAVLLLPERLEMNIPKWIVAMGDSSYSLYLSHRFIQRPIQIVMTKTGFHSGGAYVVLAILAALIFAWFVYVVIERPLLKRFKSGPVKPPAINNHPA